MTYDDLKSEWLSDSPYLAAMTSGSTGTPSKILLPKQLVRDSALRTISFFNLNSYSRLHSCIAPDFIGGKMMLIRALICGAEFTFENPSNRPLPSFTPTHSLDLVSIVPSQMKHILDHLSEMPIVKNYLIGGSSIPSEMRNKIVKANISAYESYGMTETASHIALRKISSNLLPFYPLPGIRISLNQRNCLTIDLGSDNIIITNDLAELTYDGGFFIKGRADDVIISGGKKINPLEVENIISALFPKQNICITSRPDSLWGNRVVLLIESNEPIENVDDLLAKLHNLLPSYSVPKEIITIPSLPRTSSGKIIRRQLN